MYFTCISISRLFFYKMGIVIGPKKSISDVEGTVDSGDMSACGRGLQVVCGPAGDQTQNLRAAG